MIKSRSVQQAWFNPYKIGPFGKPIKTGLLGHFLTLRKDHIDVESCTQPTSPLTWSSRLCNSWRPFFCFWSAQDNDKKQPKIMPCNGESEYAFKNSVGWLWRKWQNKCVRFFNFRPPTSCKSSVPGETETVGGGREGVEGRKQSQNTAFACPNMCGGNLELSLYL